MASVVLNRVFSEALQASHSLYKNERAARVHEWFKNPGLKAMIKEIVDVEVMVKDARQSNRMVELELSKKHRTELEVISKRHASEAEALSTKNAKIVAGLEKDIIRLVDAMISKFGVEPVEAGYHSWQAMKLNEDITCDSNKVPIGVLMLGIDSFKRKALTDSECRDAMAQYTITGKQALELTNKSRETIHLKSLAATEKPREKLQAMTDELEGLVMQLWTCDTPDSLSEMIHNVNQKKRDLRTYARSIAGMDHEVNGRLPE
jgi:hypothetical protein